MKRFILLLNHDDKSLSAYLQHCLGRGEQFEKASGNIFTFRKTEPSDERIAAVTYTNDDPDLKMKFQLEDYSALMKKRGWKILDIGKPEDIFDSRRHVFLQTDQPDLPLPLTGPKLAEKANRKETRSLIRCVTMLLLLLGFGIFFLSHDPDVFLSSNHIFFPLLAAFALWFLSGFYCIRGAVTLIKKKQCADGFRNFLAVDHAVLFCMLTVFCMFAALIIDLFLFPDTGRTVVKGNQRITVYADPVPLSLEDLSIPAEGTFRSSRLTERRGLIMQSLYGSDQSFSSPDSTENLSMISYSVFRSGWRPGLDFVENRKGLGRLPENEELAVKFAAESVRTDGHHRLSVRYPETLFVFYTSAEITGSDKDLIKEKLSLP